MPKRAALALTLAALFLTGCSLSSYRSSYSYGDGHHRGYDSSYGLLSRAITPLLDSND